MENKLIDSASTKEKRKGERLDFYASKNSPIARTFLLLCIVCAVSAPISIFLLLRDWSIVMALGLLFIYLTLLGIIDVLRRQLCRGKPVLTLTDDFLFSLNLPGKRKHLLWKDMESFNVKAFPNGQRFIEFVLRKPPGLRGIRSFWAGIHSTKLRLNLTVFSPEEQERVCAELLSRFSRFCPQSRLRELQKSSNELREAREFEANLKALQPYAWATYGLIALNLLIWGITLTEGAGIEGAPAEKLLLWGGNAASEVQKGEGWRLLTAIFLHSGFMHVAMNMLGLYFMGVSVERLYGKRLYLLIYVLSGLTGSALSLRFAAQHVVAVGASGAVFGVMGALLTAFFQNRDKLPKIFNTETVSSLAIFVFYTLLQGFRTQGVDNAAHVGGLLGGCLIALILPTRLDMNAYRRAFMGQTVIAVAVMACVIVGMSVTTPVATLDQGKIAADSEKLRVTLEKFDKAMHLALQDSKALESGKLSQREGDERSRAVFAPMFREIASELSQITLRPDNPERNAFIGDIKRLSELLAEANGMDSVYNETTQSYDAVDSVRWEKIHVEIRQTSERMTRYIEKANAKKR